MRPPYVHLAILIAFMVNTFGPLPMARADDFRLPTVGVRVHLSPEFTPVIMRGMEVFKNDPLKFNFIVDAGDASLNSSDIQNESKKLISYFLASLTIPEKDLWVNLSPYEKNRIIPEAFGLTQMGRDTLAQDYLLKQITASLIYPEEEIGRKFWKRIYEESFKKFGTTNMPINTFNKVWILPDESVIYENAKTNSVFIVKSTLKVMLEQDYLALGKNTAKPRNDVNALGSQIVREIVLPELTREVNTGKNFASLRQLYSSLILATWYKQKLKNSVLEKAYINKNKTAGVNTDDPNIKNKIYAQYLRAFRKGVYNYIKEETDPGTNQMIPRKYFSGGLVLDVHPIYGKASDAEQAMVAQAQVDKFFEVSAGGALVTAGGALRKSFMRGTTQEIPEALLEEWKEKAIASGDIRKVYINLEHTVDSYQLVDGRLSQYGMFAYHFTDNHGHLIIITTFDRRANFELYYEAIQHEEEEFKYRAKGKTAQEAHVLAAAYQAIVASYRREVIPLHKYMIQTASTEDLMVLYTEDRSNHLYAVYQEMGTYYFEKYLAYQIIFHNAVKAELKQRLAALGEDLPILQLTNGLPIIEKLRAEVQYRYRDEELFALMEILQGISPIDVADHLRGMGAGEQLEWLRMSQFLADHEEDADFVADLIAQSDLPQHTAAIVSGLSVAGSSVTLGPIGTPSSHPLTPVEAATDKSRGGALAAVIGAALAILAGGMWLVLSDNTRQDQPVTGLPNKISTTSSTPSPTPSSPPRQYIEPNPPKENYVSKYEPLERPAPKKESDLTPEGTQKWVPIHPREYASDRVRADGNEAKREAEAPPGSLHIRLQVLEGSEYIHFGDTWVTEVFTTLTKGGVFRERKEPTIEFIDDDPRRIVAQIQLPASLKGSRPNIPRIHGWAVSDVKGIPMNADGTLTEDIPVTMITYTLRPARWGFDLRGIGTGSINEEIALLKATPTFNDLAKELQSTQGDFSETKKVIQDALGHFMTYNEFTNTDVGDYFMTFLKEALEKSNGVINSQCNIGSLFVFILAKAAGLDAVYTAGWLDEGTGRIEGDVSHAIVLIKNPLTGLWEKFESTLFMKEISLSREVGPVLENQYIINDINKKGLTLLSGNSIPTAWGLIRIARFLGINMKELKSQNPEAFQRNDSLIKRNALLKLPDGIGSVQLSDKGKYPQLIKILDIHGDRKKILDRQYYAGGIVFLTPAEILHLKSVGFLPSHFTPGDIVVLPVKNRARVSVKKVGGINLGHVDLRITKDGLGVITSFDDPAQLALLMKSSGLSPIIYGVQQLSISMVQGLINQ